jgi:hypothetical protein
MRVMTFGSQGICELLVRFQRARCGNDGGPGLSERPGNTAAEQRPGTGGYQSDFAAKRKPVKYIHGQQESPEVDK